MSVAPCVEYRRIAFGVENRSLADLVPESRRQELRLDFNGISKSVDGKVILSKVSGSAEPGKILAIIGPSGSGKTTLINSLGGRQKIDSGTITLNGKPLNKESRRHIALAHQQDLFMPNLTLEDTLEFHSQMRMPSYMSHAQKKEFKDRIITSFNLENARKTRMGGALERGLSGGELKRANIACEMFSLSPVLLIDEPTTGLDSHNALSIIQLLQEYVKKNRITLVMIVHQPSSMMFQLVDELLLLVNGEVAYFGAREKVISHFEKLGMQMEDQYNPADFIVDQVYNEHNLKMLTEAAQEPGEQIEVRVDPKENGNCIRPELGVRNDSRLNSSLRPKYQVPFCKQTWLLTKRSFKEVMSRFKNKLIWINTLVLSLVAGSVWFRMERIESNIPSVKGWGFFTYSLWMLNTVYETMITFPAELAIINRERAAGMYHLFAYYLAKTIAELPCALIFPTVFLIVSNIMIGIHSFEALALSWVILINCTLFAQGIGLFVGSISSDLMILNLACSLICFPTMLFGGYYVQSVHPWIYWVPYTSAVRYAFQAMQIVEFHFGSEITCAKENSLYDACHVTNSTVIPRNDIFDAEENPVYWLIFNILVILFASIVFRILAYLVLKFYNSPTRTI